MSEGLMTEREWRRQYVRIARKRTDCWGAQCWKPKPRWRQNRRNWACLLLGAWAVALLLPVIAARSPSHGNTASCSRRQKPLLAAVPESSAVSYVLPEGIACSRQIFSKEQLLRGKLLYLDENHALPDGTPAPNTTEHRPIRQWHGAGQRSDHQERQGNHSGAGASVCGFAGQRRGRFQGQPGNHDAAGAAGMAAESLSGAGSQSFSWRKPQNGSCRRRTSPDRANCCRSIRSRFPPRRTQTARWRKLPAGGFYCSWPGVMAL